ncbi:hypothetical protein [Niallia sp. MER 6]|uniref:hypothetical protein n=1 Tax=Niallia sp. MER 6 TaxID=2939567 RepID=UPI00203FD7AE|nr:hypothetical protein [Niallia sp. MER 6]MCM3031396.1 hypothetical protein [Niallia sp. MER 6]
MKYFIGVVMVISGVLLLVITKNKEFKEIEQSLVIAYSFLIFGIVYLLYKYFRKS